MPVLSLALFRLLFQHKNGKISNAHWHAVEALQSNFHGYSTDDAVFTPLTVLAKEAEEKTQYAMPSYRLWSLACTVSKACAVSRLRQAERLTC
jgi:hypothetical protein